MFAHACSPTLPERRSRRAGWLAVGLCLVAGCATTRQGTELPDISNWEARNAVLGAVREWEFIGRIAVKAGEEGFNGKFTWAQRGDVFRATVGGPLGIGTVRIEGDGRSVVLTDKEGVETTLRDAETELYYRYGWTIPIASLRYWALGIPDPSIAAETELDDAERLARLRQNDWTVEISRYRDAGGQQMPRILSANNAQTRVRMVVDKWLFFER